MHDHTRGQIVCTSEAVGFSERCSKGGIAMSANKMKLVRTRNSKKLATRAVGVGGKSSCDEGDVRRERVQKAIIGHLADAYPSLRLGKPRPKKPAPAAGEKRRLRERKKRDPARNRQAKNEPLRTKVHDWNRQLDRPGLNDGADSRHFAGCQSHSHRWWPYWRFG